MPFSGGQYKEFYCRSKSSCEERPSWDSPEGSILVRRVRAESVRVESVSAESVPDDNILVGNISAINISALKCPIGGNVR